MGNAPDKTIDKSFMLQHAQLEDHFMAGDQPLFHAQDIKFPLSTDQMKIVDATGRRVKLAGGNWSGGHMCRHCVDGLQCRPLKDIAMDIRFKFKMNCIRLTYSLQLIYDNNVVPSKYLKANPELIGKTSMQIFDITVKTLTDVGLMVILNNHTSTSQWCCSNDDGDGLWWSRQYPEYLFFDHVRDFAKRYKDNERVIGMDMRNQIRKANGLEPTWGDGNPKTDWKRAAQLSAEIALKEAPHWLIVIGGLNYQLDLTGIKDDPIKISNSRKLVYSGHFYGFSWPIPSWNVYTYDNFKKRLFNTQTYVRTLGVPFLLGQFGNNNQDIPWRYLMQYLKQTDIDWTYWALDGFKCEPEKDQTYGVFTNDFSGARHPQMLEDMIAVGPPKTALENYWSYLPGKSQKKQEKSQQKLQTYQNQIQVQQSHDVQGQKAATSGQQYKVQARQPQSVETHIEKEEKMSNKPQQQIQEFNEKKKVYFEQLSKLNESKQGQSHQGPYEYQNQANPPIINYQNSWQPNSLNITGWGEPSFGIPNSNNSNSSNSLNTYHNNGNNNLGSNKYNNPDHYHH